MSHLDIVLDHVTWIEESNRLNVLLDGLVVLFLLEEFIGMLLDNLALNFAREICFFCDSLSLSIVRLLHQVVYLDIVFHWVKLDELTNYIIIFVIDLSDVIDALLALGFLDLNIDNCAVGRWVPEHSNLVLEVINGQLRRGATNSSGTNCCLCD